MIGDSYPHTQQEYYEALMKNYSVTPLDWMAEVNMLLKLVSSIRCPKFGNCWLSTRLNSKFKNGFGVFKIG